MSSSDYIKAAVSLESSNWHEVPKGPVFAHLENAITVLNKLDEIKKAIFYGRNLDTVRGQSAAPAGNLDLDPIQRRLFHGILGIATETGELLEALIANIRDGREFDIVNLIEELGDQDWYKAVLCDVLGVTFEEVDEKNIAKLRKRYPQKFTEKDANERDIGGERVILEERTPPKVSAA